MILRSSGDDHYGKILHFSFTFNESSICVKSSLCYVLNSSLITNVYHLLFTNYSTNLITTFVDVGDGVLVGLVLILVNSPKYSILVSSSSVLITIFIKVRLFMLSCVCICVNVAAFC